MNNLQRLQLETKGIDLEQNELMVYLAENGLDAYLEYNPQSMTDKKAIYSTALSMLESVANNPTLMKAVKIDDMTVSEFHENLMKRIDQLTFKVRTMRTENSNADVFMLYV
ncbi:hypothetical protein B1B04_12450 [Lysinibacillus sp. KCTC 33748]|uniref:hypothetical protein n=1 Tax=unclassified Lysinibacillus TaxID=2636778 RepID=UPI0009A6CFAC|nr:MULTISPECIES: hypothetical protein [unclassified Lysinibacillus]OXS73528.1 hypothetical protein B1B04_12450 [Lysinibacillus sp. KCTC 33748]SKB79516.1 hypothetical protein SAMN06295926_10892 [Lysinibacillus sp. AC-3]